MSYGYADAIDKLMLKANEYVVGDVTSYDLIGAAFRMVAAHLRVSGKEDEAKYLEQKAKEIEENF